MYAGIDVGGDRKGFHIAVIDSTGLRHGEQLGGASSEYASGDVARSVRAVMNRWEPRVVAIDSPRSPAPTGHRARPCEKEFYRQGICGIRWTPDKNRLEGNNYYRWILNGFTLYDALGQGRWEVIECFPTASLTQWVGPREDSRASWARKGIARVANVQGDPRARNQDQRDAIAAALTAKQYFERPETTSSFGPLIVPLVGSRP